MGKWLISGTFSNMFKVGRIEINLDLYLVEQK